MTNREKISVAALIQAPVAAVWEYYNGPGHIMKWNCASPDWHTPRAENDLRVGGRFVSRMEARDGSSGFDFEGVYDTVRKNEEIAYTMPDGRQVHITFDESLAATNVNIVFDAENTYPLEYQREGWQAILNNFKKYCEDMAKM
ncbi:MAG: SRPBCC family protein [Eubacteriales bacterium]|jgi:uncharacterized protein YndB with AHSA1/START domain|nr:SRPBCC family protein [Eubacteriales bacterium]MDD4105664.1 SRPBCC family protein [Eubacteriales bacterium]MDD4710243.1 SRPBCC family protein [Eubacteriales bacterium]NLO15455.1 polyketide cyclase [Clostridiales bacterium]